MTDPAAPATGNSLRYGPRLPSIIMIFVAVLAGLIEVFSSNGAAFGASLLALVAILAVNLVALLMPAKFWGRIFVLVYALANTILSAVAVALSQNLGSGTWPLFLFSALAISLLDDPLASVFAPVGALLTFVGLAISGGFSLPGLAVAVLRAALVAGGAWILSLPVRRGSLERIRFHDTEVALDDVRTRLQSLLRTSKDSILTLNDQLEVIGINQTAENAFGLTSDQALRIPVSRLVTSEYFDLEEHLRKLNVQAADSNSEGFEVNCVRSDQVTFPAEMLVSHTLCGNQSCYTLIIQDITERKQSEEAFQQANEKLTSWVNELELRNRDSLLLNELGDILQACLNPEEAYTAISETVQHLFPQGMGILGILNASRTFVEMQAKWGTGTLLPEEQVFAPEECWALRRGRPTMENSGTVNLSCKHVLQLAHAGYLCVPLLAQGESLGLLHLRDLPADRDSRERIQQLAVTLAEHISLSLSNLRLRETLRSQSVHDPLTGLYNRRYMEESFERELARAQRSQRPLGVIMMDIDHFKLFNDTYGHAAGDALLRELGAYAQKRLRGSDIACRYGGEEFTLILPEASLEDTRKKADQIREEISQLRYQNPALSEAAITVSIGVSGFPEHGGKGDELLHAADGALYQAKREGRNRVVVSPSK